METSVRGIIYLYLSVRISVLHLTLGFSYSASKASVKLGETCGYNRFVDRGSASPLTAKVYRGSCIILFALREKIRSTRVTTVQRHYAAQRSMRRHDGFAEIHLIYRFFENSRVLLRKQ